MASQIYFQGGKKPSQGKDAHESKGKGTQFPNASKTQGKDSKKVPSKEKGYKGRSKLSPEEMEQYCKDGKCFKSGETGHVLRVCPKKTQGNASPIRQGTYSYM